MSVLLPTLNEAENIVPLIERIRAAVPYLHEVVVVDDASPDGTAEIAERLARQDGRIRVERRLSDPGLTKSLAHGARVATGEVLVWMDCDLSMPPEDVPRLLEGIARGYDVVVGSRFLPGGGDARTARGTADSPLAAVAASALNAFLRVVLDRRVTDWTSGFIAVRREIVVAIGLRGDYGEYFIDLIFRSLHAGHRILEVPYRLVPRQRGTSKTATDPLGYLRRGRKYIAVAVALRWRAVRGRL